MNFVKNNNNLFKKTVFFSVFIFIGISSCLNSFAFADNKKETTSFYYFYDEKDILSRSDKDLIINYGQMLSTKNVDLIFNIKETNNKSKNEECKDVFYSYVKNNEIDKKIIVATYYTKNSDFQIYDDYGILTKKDLEEVATYLKKFQTNNNLNNGIIFGYETLSKNLNKNLDLNISSIENLEISNPYKFSIFSMKNIVAICIVIVLLIGFRRNKNYS